VCRTPSIEVSHEIETGKTFDPPRHVATTEACDVLTHWNNQAQAEARGANLWDAVWARVSRIASPDLYVKHFDAADPVHTPAGLNVHNPAVTEAFGAAVLSFQDADRPLDETRGNALYVSMAGTRIPLFGGCDLPGYFTSACVPWGTGARQDIQPADLVGNTYMQVVDFNHEDGNAYTMLASGQSDDPASPYYLATTRAYASKLWKAWRITPNRISEDKSPANDVVSGR
jgi:acyl-homoserine-lactone acylase